MLFPRPQPRRCRSSRSPRQAERGVGGNLCRCGHSEIPALPLKSSMLTALQTPFLGKEQHPSLGPHLKPGGTSGALNTFNKLVSQGIRPSDTLVDYGCGTLRVGSLFIEHLEAGHYIGMDIDQRILADGLNQLPAELVESKRPTLEVISPDSLARVAARQPRWVCSKGSPAARATARTQRVLWKPVSSHSCGRNWLALFADRLPKQKNRSEGVGARLRSFASRRSEAGHEIREA